MKRLNKEKLKKNLDSEFETMRKNAIIFGASAIVMQDDEILYKNNFGHTSCDCKTPVSGKTIYRIASMTKPISAVAAMQLVEKRLLSLDDKVSKFLPKFADMNVGIKNEDGTNKIFPAKTPLKIRDLLCHTSGILNSEADCAYDKIIYDECMHSLSQTVDCISGTLLGFEPMSTEKYNAWGAFDVLARIIEIISGESYNDYLRKNIFIPCEMPDTTFTPSKEQFSRMIKMHNISNGKNAEYEMPEGCVFENFPVTKYTGGAGLASTLDDYFNFAKMLTDGGIFNGRRILSEESVKTISTPCAPFVRDGGHEKWGLGVRVIISDNNTLPKNSFGWSGAYGTHFWIDRENKITVVFMRNSQYLGGAESPILAELEKCVMKSF